MTNEDIQRPLNNFILIFIHREEDIQETAWPANFPLPRWGESFRWNGEDFVIEESGWVLDELSFDVPGAPEGAKAAAITYHLYISEEGEESALPVFPRP